MNHITCKNVAILSGSWLFLLSFLMSTLLQNINIVKMIFWSEQTGRLFLTTSLGYNIFLNYDVFYGHLYACIFTYRRN